MSTHEPAPSEDAREPLSMEPSTLFAFWPEPDPPLDEEVRLALQREFSQCRRREDLESQGNILWGGLYSFPGLPAEVLIWAEDRADLSDGLLEDAQLDEDSLGAARKARWLIGVETFLDPEAPQEAFHNQIKILCAACVPGLCAVYDDNAVVIRPGTQLVDLASSTVPPRASLLYAVHAVAGYGGTWLHTHGLNRTGAPELDMVGLPGDNLPEGYELIDAAVDALLGGARPDPQGRMAVGQDLDLRLLSLPDAMKRVDRRMIGGPEDRVDDFADHGGNRLVIFDRDRDGPPLAVLSRLTCNGVLFKSQAETRRLSALSRERWGTFGQLFVIHHGDAWRFHVKLACPRRGSGGMLEHLWFEVLELEPDKVKGRLISDPLDVPGLHAGDESWHSLDHLTDWIIITPDGPYDPECAPALLARH